MTDPTRLDAFAEAITAARTTGQYADLEPAEQAFINTLGEIGPDLDRRTVGAAWMILGQLFATSLGQQPAHLQAEAAGRLLNVARFAGQRLYQGAPLAQPCPLPRPSGTACRFVAKGVMQETLDAMMRAHAAVYHPDATWPPNLDAIAPPPNCVVCGKALGIDGELWEVTKSGAMCPKCLKGWAESGEQAQRLAEALERRRAAQRPACSGCHRASRPFLAYSDGRTLCASCCLDRGYTTMNEVRQFNVHPTAPPLSEADLPSEDARGIVGRCVHCGKPIYVVGAEGEITGRLTTEGAYCDPCYKKLGGPGEDAAVEPGDAQP